MFLGVSRLERISQVLVDSIFAVSPVHPSSVSQEEQYVRCWSAARIHSAACVVVGDAGTITLLRPYLVAAAAPARRPCFLPRWVAVAVVVVVAAAAAAAAVSWRHVL